MLHLVDLCPGIPGVPLLMANQSIDMFLLSGRQVPHVWKELQAKSLQTSSAQRLIGNPGSTAFDGQKQCNPQVHMIINDCFGHPVLPLVGATSIKARRFFDKKHLFEKNVC